MTAKAPSIRVRKLTVEHLQGGGCLCMDEAGQMSEHLDAEAVVRWVKRRDAKAMRQGESTATVIDWLDRPEGWTPPEVDA